ncbi:hypothetical protein Btru_071457, partial [Bulinus truncatus]
GNSLPYRALLPPFSSLTSTRPHAGNQQHSIRQATTPGLGFAEDRNTGGHHRAGLQHEEKWYSGTSTSRSFEFGYSQGLVQPPVADMSPNFSFSSGLQACGVGPQHSSASSSTSAVDSLPQIPLCQVESLLSAAEQKPLSSGASHPSQPYEDRVPSWDFPFGSSSYHLQSPFHSYPSSVYPFSSKNSEDLMEVFDSIPTDNANSYSSGKFYSISTSNVNMVPDYFHSHPSAQHNSRHLSNQQNTDRNQEGAREYHFSEDRSATHSDISIVKSASQLHTTGSIKNINAQSNKVSEAWKTTPNQLYSDTGQVKPKKAKQKKKRVAKPDIKSVNIPIDNDPVSPGQCLSPTFIASLSSKRALGPSSVVVSLQHPHPGYVNVTHQQVPLSGVSNMPQNVSLSSQPAMCVRPLGSCPTTSVDALPSSFISSSPDSSHKVCQSLTVDVSHINRSPSPYQFSPNFLASLSSRRVVVKPNHNYSDSQLVHTVNMHSSDSYNKNYLSSVTDMKSKFPAEKMSRSPSPNPISPGFLASLSAKKPDQFLQGPNSTQTDPNRHPDVFSDIPETKYYRPLSVDSQCSKFQYPTPPMDYDYSRQHSPLVSHSPSNNLFVQGLTPPSETETPPLPTPPSSAELTQTSFQMQSLSKEEQTSRILEIIAREREKANMTSPLQEPKRKKKKRKSDNNMIGSQDDFYGNGILGSGEPFSPGLNTNSGTILRSNCGHVIPESFQLPPVMMQQNNTHSENKNSVAMQPPNMKMKTELIPDQDFNCDNNLGSFQTPRQNVTHRNHIQPVSKFTELTGPRDPYAFDESETDFAEGVVSGDKIVNSQFIFESSAKDKSKIVANPLGTIDEKQVNCVRNNSVNQGMVSGNNLRFIPENHSQSVFSIGGQFPAVNLVKSEPFLSPSDYHQASESQNKVTELSQFNMNNNNLPTALIKKDHCFPEKFSVDLSSVITVKQEPQDNAQCFSHRGGDHLFYQKNSPALESRSARVQPESKKKRGRPLRLACGEFMENLKTNAKKCKAADAKQSVSAASSVKFRVNGVDIKPDDLKLDHDLVDRLANNLMEVADCSCLSPDHIPSEAIEGPYYTQLGAARDIPAVRKIMEQRTGVTGPALRIEKVIFTGKEGKSKEGCPVAKWIIRRSGPDEKYLCVVRKRPGHFCDTSVIIVVIVAWEGVMTEQADTLYNFLITTLPKSGLETDRRCGLNEKKTCACQGVDLLRRGASFSFGCSWSMYYNGCKFARSQSARKFKLMDNEMEEILGNKLENLATDIAPLYNRLVPDAYRNQTQFENQAEECRLGKSPGRPFSGVTAVVDFCCHSHRDCHNMNNGCTVVVNLTKHRGFEKPEDEQYHVLPLYILDQTDESGSMEGQMDKIRKGSLEVLSRYMTQVRTRSTPYRPCKRNRTTPKKQGPQRSPKRPKLGRAMSYPPASQQGTESPATEGNCYGLSSESCPVGDSKEGRSKKNAVAPGVGLDLDHQENMTYTDLMSQQGKPGFHDLYTKFWDYFYTNGVFPPRTWTIGGGSANSVIPEKTYMFSSSANTVLQPSCADQVFLHRQQQNQAQRIQQQNFLQCNKNQDELKQFTRQHSLKIQGHQQHNQQPRQQQQPNDDERLLQQNSVLSWHQAGVNSCSVYLEARQPLPVSHPSVVGSSNVDTKSSSPSHLKSPTLNKHWSVLHTEHITPPQQPSHIPVSSKPHIPLQASTVRSLQGTDQSACPNPSLFIRDHQVKAPPPPYPENFVKLSDQQFISCKPLVPYGSVTENISAGMSDLHSFEQVAYSESATPLSFLSTGQSSSNTFLKQSASNSGIVVHNNSQPFNVQMSVERSHGDNIHSSQDGQLKASLGENIHSSQDGQSTASLGENIHSSQDGQSTASLGENIHSSQDGQSMASLGENNQVNLKGSDQMHSGQSLTPVPIQKSENRLTHVESHQMTQGHHDNSPASSSVALLPPNVINTLISTHVDLNSLVTAKTESMETGIQPQLGEKVKVHKSEGFVVPKLGQGPSEPPYQVIDSSIMSIETDENKEVFEDPAMGGVAIALCHGAVLFEVAKRELHATTALKEPNRYQPKRISLVFYQHKNLNLSRHGLEEYERKMEERKSQAEQAKLIEDMETNGFLKGELGELASFPNLTKGTFGKVFNFPETKKILFPLHFPRYLDDSTLEQITPVMFACMSIAFPKYMKEAFPNASTLPRLMNGYFPVKISSTLSDRRVGQQKDPIKLEDIKVDRHKRPNESWSPLVPSVTSMTTASMITRWVHNDTNVTGPYNQWIQMSLGNEEADGTEDDTEASLKEKMFESLSQLDSVSFGADRKLSDPTRIDVSSSEKEKLFSLNDTSCIELCDGISS